MEINKGPDMSAKDKRDSELKHGVVKDIINIVNNNYNNNGFINVLQVKDGIIINNIN